MGISVATSELEDFGAFYRRTYAAAYRTALGVTSSAQLAEDATQEAYCAAYRGRGRFRGDALAETWLQRIVVRKATDQLRHARSRPVVELYPEIEVEDGDPAPSLAAERTELLSALACLIPRQRAAIVLRYFHDYPLRAVGEVLGTSEGGAAMLVQRALVHLREEIGETIERNAAEADRGGAR
jgi:RNA polymerase sigma-70 factor (ECF subfamily)